MVEDKRCSGKAWHSLVLMPKTHSWEVVPGWDIMVLVILLNSNESLMKVQQIRYISSSLIKGS
jgi:hypothetical protein